MTASCCSAHEYPHGGRPSTASRGNSDGTPLIPDRYPIRRTPSDPVTCGSRTSAAACESRPSWTTPRSSSGPRLPGRHRQPGQLHHQRPQPRQHRLRIRRQAIQPVLFHLEASLPQSRIRNSGPYGTEASP